MTRLLFAIILLFAVSVCHAQTVERLQGEGIEAFITRITPEQTELAHHLVSTRNWGNDSNTIIALYGYDDSTDRNVGYNKIYGHAYVPEGKNIYRDVTFGPIEEDGGYPVVLSVFFANTDKDAAKELVILCKYRVSNYDFGGELYKPFIFDDPADDESKLVYFGELSAGLFGMEGRWRDGKANKAKYKTAKEIKAKLKEMGY
jgi:hypothetical protein